LDNDFGNLVQILEEQKSIYEELLSLGRQKQGELVKGSVEELDKLTRKEEALIFRNGRLEEERCRCAAEIVARCGLEENSTLQELLKAAPEEARRELERLRASLAEILDRMEKVNRENMNLTQQSLRFIRFSLETMAGETETTYTAEKEIKIEALNRLLDKKI
jgi:hypothetical protein